MLKKIFLPLLSLILFISFLGALTPTAHAFDCDNRGPNANGKGQQCSKEDFPNCFKSENGVGCKNGCPFVADPSNLSAGVFCATPAKMTPAPSPSGNPNYGCNPSQRDPQCPSSTYPYCETFSPTTYNTCSTQDGKCLFRSNPNDSHSQFFCALINPTTNAYGNPYPTTSCPICPSGHRYQNGNCKSINENVSDVLVQPTIMPCLNASQTCQPGLGCFFPSPSPPPIDPNSFNPCGSQDCSTIQSGLGISIPTDAAGFAAAVLGILLAIGGAILLIIIIVTGYHLMFSQGDPEKVKAAREQLTGAVAGLVFMIFSVAILAFIGINILHIPQFLP